jgi:hypothetical protein
MARRPHGEGQQANLSLLIRNRRQRRGRLSQWKLSPIAAMLNTFITIETATAVSVQPEFRHRSRLLCPIRPERDVRRGDRARFDQGRDLRLHAEFAAPDLLHGERGDDTIHQWPALQKPGKQLWQTKTIQPSYFPLDELCRKHCPFCERAEGSPYISSPMHQSFAAISPSPIISGHLGPSCLEYVM